MDHDIKLLTGNVQTESQVGLYEIIFDVCVP